MTRQTLATSHNYTIEHEYELAYLCTPDGRKVVVGDFYGDPQAALIDADENWCAIGGCGLIIYRLTEPFDEYACGKPSKQYREFHREPPGVCWIEELKQLGAREIELKLDSGAIQVMLLPDFDGSL